MWRERGGARRCTPADPCRALFARGPADVRALQRLVGNQATVRLLGAGAKIAPIIQRRARGRSSMGAQAEPDTGLAGRPLAVLELRRLPPGAEPARVGTNGANRLRPVQAAQQPREAQARAPGQARDRDDHGHVAVNGPPARAAAPRRLAEERRWAELAEAWTGTPSAERGGGPEPGQPGRSKARARPALQAAGRARRLQWRPPGRRGADARTSRGRCSRVPICAAPSSGRWSGWLCGVAGRDARLRHLQMRS
jgi:hypothetical protein